MNIRFRNFVTALAIAGASVIGATQASAVTLLSNLGSTVDGDYGGTPDAADGFFTGTFNLKINSVDVFWELGNGGVNRVGFFADNGGLPGLTQVGSWFTNAAATTSGTIINYTGSAILQASTSYWMAIEISDGSEAGFTFGQVMTADASTGGAFIDSSTPASAWGTIATGSWSSDNANLLYALNGNAISSVPLPAGLPLLLAAFGVVGVARARRS